MRIKTKLTLGVGLLFILIVLLAIIGGRQINKLSNDTKNILVANYNTLDYTRQMLSALDELKTDTESHDKFLINLHKQEKNITEAGEQEATENLAKHFSELMRLPDEKSLPAVIRKDLNEIMMLNMDAIQRKSKMAEETAESATFWIAVTGTLCFLIAFTLLINFPGVIANPIKELTESIKQIASKNYESRVHFKGSTEFNDLAEAFNIMAAKLEEYDHSNLAKLIIEKKRIETLINNLHHPVIGLDENKKILFANNEALKVLALSAESIMGKSASDISLSNDLMRTLLKELVNVENSSVREEKPLKIFADNKESYFEKEIIPIVITSTGEKIARPKGHVIILQNITPFKELDFAKTNFIALISHELKTPISSIMLGLKLMEDKRTGILNEEQKHLLQSINDDSERLLKITGELLNLSQVETGNIKLNIQNTPPEQIVNFALGAVKVQAEQKHVKLTLSSDKDLPEIKADAEKTTWVLVNFLTNAIRYSNEGSEVIIDLNKKDDKVIFSVQDFGKGIETKYTEKIFDRYFQVPGSSKSGTGLGLAISKEFIETQGGKINVESEVAKGSRFWFSLNVVT